MSLTKKSSGISWLFSDQNDGSFYVEDANHLPILYFPLMNSKGMKSFVTPVLKGDICKDFNPMNKNLKYIRLQSFHMVYFYISNHELQLHLQLNITYIFLLSLIFCPYH